MQFPQPARAVDFDPDRARCTYCSINYICKNCFDDRVKNLEEEVEFLKKWSFTPTELSGTGDVTILCTSDGSSLHAHSSVLSSKSDVLKAMLEGNERKQVKINEFGEEIVKAFVKFLYTAEVSEEDMRDHTKELVKLAHFYKVKTLIKELDKFISKSIIGAVKDSIVEAIKMGYLYGLKKTKKMVPRFIVDSDPNYELFDAAFKELSAENRGLPLEFSRDIFTYCASKR